VAKRPKKVKTETPRGLIVTKLRQIFMWSPERSAALKRDDKTCQVCGKRESKAKGKECSVHVHHLQEGDINWDRIVAVIRKELLCPPEMLITLCKEHHQDCHHKGEL